MQRPFFVRRVLQLLVDQIGDQIDDQAGDAKTLAEPTNSRRS